MFYSISFTDSPYSALIYKQLLLITRHDSCAQPRQINMKMVNMEIHRDISDKHSSKRDYLNGVKQKVIMCFTRDYQMLNKPIACFKLL
jgi:hypothetical protein